MARKVGLGSRRLRALGIVSAVFMALSSLALTAILVLDILGVNPLVIDEARTYWIQYESEEYIFYDAKYKRGEKIEKPANPKHSPNEYYEYTFRGWDISGDNKPDIIPNHAYYSFLAVAVYQKKQIKPLTKGVTAEEIESGAYRG